ncbi:MAG: hypothetical protein WC010_01415 [Candidatus Absconditabacterales bacterium]
MKKGKTLYLWLIVVMFIIIMIPYFQNAGGAGAGISFYFMVFKGITGVYLYLITFGIIEGILTVLYVQSLLKDIKDQEPTKFDLNQ